MMISIFHYFLIFIIYSFIGWAMEVILTFVKTGRFVNRGFLIGPCCPIYGFGSLLITSLLRPYTHDYIALFVLATAICMILEYITSYIMEKLFKARWWDYSDQKYNINGRICLETAVPFGLGALFVVYAIHPVVLNLLGVMNDTTTFIISVCILVLFLADIIISFNIISKFKNTGLKIRKDSTEEITKKIKEYLIEQSRLTKRLISAFPNVQASINNIMFRQQELKRELERKEEKLKLEVEEKEFNLRKQFQEKQMKLKKNLEVEQKKLKKMSNKKNNK